MRHVATPRAWEPTKSGWRWGRYEVSLGAPGSWVLAARGRELSSHARASDAANEASRLDVARHKRRNVTRNLVAVVVSLAALTVAYSNRTVTNEAHAPAAEFVGGLEAAYRSVELGGRSVDDFTDTDGIAGASFVAAAPIDLGGQGAEPRPYLALVAVHQGECYVVRWSPGGAALTGVLAPDLPCEPDPRLVPVSLFTRFASQTPGTAEFTWDGVLPPPTFQARWFVPLVVAVGFIVARGIVGLTLALIRPPRRRIPPLSIAATTRRTPVTTR